MLFNSLEFCLVFLPVAFLGYLLVVRSGRDAVVVWLLFVSFAFYAWWNIAHAIMLLALACANYAIGGAVWRARTERKGGFALAAGIVLNLLVLVWFKYAFFFAAAVDASVAQEWGLDRIVLPLAISFFIFQKIAYLVDLHRGDATPGSFVDYLLFVLFFPQLIAGPIVHWRQIAPQFIGFDKVNDRALDIAIGLSIFAIGLFKKVVIADSVSPIADVVFGHARGGGNLTFFEAWSGALAFTVQIYFDFSGYSDMAIGLARMFGIALPENFNSPYKAADIIDFWRRWHMTLSAFLRDYLYKPLGGNRKGPVRRSINVLLVMLLGGLWHGAAWTFVVWGGLHGIFIVFTYAYRRFVPLGGTTTRRLAEWSATFLAVVVAWVFFRAESFSDAARILSGMIDVGSIALPGRAAMLLNALAPEFGVREIGLFPNLTPVGLAPDMASLAVLAAGLLACFALPNTREFLESRHRLAWRRSLPWAIGLGLAASLSLVMLPRSGQFIYFQF